MEYSVLHRGVLGRDFDPFRIPIAGAHLALFAYMPKDHRREGEGERRAERRSYDQLDRRTRLVALWHVLGFSVDEIAVHLATTRSDVYEMLQRLQEFANGSDWRAS